MGEREKASPSFAFKGPRIDRIFRSRVMDRDASSASSFKGACVVWWGWIRSVLMSSMWKGIGVKAGISEKSGWDTPEVTRSDRSVRALPSKCCQ